MMLPFASGLDLINYIREREKKKKQNKHVFHKPQNVRHVSTKGTQDKCAIF